MRRSDDIFRTENNHGAGIGNFSAVSVVTSILTVFSLISAICVIVNFDEFTERIATWVVELLLSGFLILVPIVIIAYFVMRMKWKMYKSFWRW